jgi:hypothetical protein
LFEQAFSLLVTPSAAKGLINQAFFLVDFQKDASLLTGLLRTSFGVSVIINNDNHKGGGRRARHTSPSSIAFSFHQPRMI